MRNLSTGNLSTNSTKSIPRIYEPFLLDFRIRVFLILIYALTAIYSAGANSLLLYFTRKKQRKKKGQNKRAFERNTVSIFFQSLACSGFLCGIITYPLAITSFSTDFLRHHWICMVVRYFSVAFPVITAINLIVIGTERCIGIFRPFWAPSKHTVFKFVIMAWVIGGGISLIPASMFSSMPLELDDNKFTFICALDIKSRANKVGAILLSVFLYILPAAFLTVINIQIFRFLRKRKRNCNNVDSKRKRVTRSIITSTFMMLIFSFLLPYIVCASYPALRFFLKRYTSYEVDQILRSLSGFLAFSNSAIAPTVIFYSLSDMRNMLKRMFLGRSKSHREVAAYVIESPNNWIPPKQAVANQN